MELKVMSLSKFSARLKDLMQEEKMSARKLSRTLNLQRKSISLWCAGKYYPKFDSLIKLSNFFEVSVGYLLGINDQVNPNKKHVLEEQSKIFFHNHLVEYIEKNDLSYYEISKELGVGQTVFTRWIRENSMPETTNLIKLSYLMEESIDYILGLE